MRALQGALHDHGRATLIGERTFGKGVVQAYFPLGDGSGVKLTVAKYLTPAAYDVTANGGIAPDQICRDYPHGAHTLACTCMRASGSNTACSASCGNYVLLLLLLLLLLVILLVTTAAAAPMATALRQACSPEAQQMPA